MPGLRGNKYQPLVDFLAAQPAGVDEVRLSFVQMEAMLGAPLPATAYLRVWWTSLSAAYPQVRRWRQAGWEVTTVTWHDGQRWVTFRHRLVDGAS